MAIAQQAQRQDAQCAEIEVVIEAIPLIPHIFQHILRYQAIQKSAVVAKAAVVVDNTEEKRVGPQQVQLSCILPLKSEHLPLYVKIL